jgi:Holliday junction resolvase
MNFEDIRVSKTWRWFQKGFVWQHFERLAAFIFEKNNCSVKVNTVKTHNKTKRQYDVIAWKGDQTFLVECRKWEWTKSLERKYEKIQRIVKY